MDASWNPHGRQMPADDRMNTETRSTRIAVFIDFDNVEIGVKSTLGGQFDIGLVLEAIKERGEIVTKIAYSDWKRAGDYSRILTQHAIRMVQRNLTPGGDKNGADITMALDALEMAFTHDHINAFVIVGGDSDFISLVEKLKQYGRKVIVVGGRQFTSVTMQRNCHEFIAYENLVGAARGRSSERGGRPVAASSDIAKALPLVKRALKVLSEREVTPQLGLLKSTLLQLDSTFSEREYGAGSFRDFMEKVAQAGAVVLRHSGRSMLVETVEDGAAPPPPPAAEGEAPSADTPRARVAEERPHHDERHHDDRPRHDDRAAHGDEDAEEEEALPPSPMSMQDGIRDVQHAFTHATTPPRFPMYVRQAKQFLRNAIEGFDERKYGFASVVDLLRAAGKEGVLRLERDRQGAIRVFPGGGIATKPAATPGHEPELELDETVDVEVPPERVSEPVEAEIEAVAAEVPEPTVIDGETLEEPGDNFGNVEGAHAQMSAVAAVEASGRGRGRRKSTSTRSTKSTRPAAKSAKSSRPAPRRAPRRKSGTSE
jgi:uncharacterized protein (TIGR00288 family)